jgi:hypothetical protein
MGLSAMLKFHSPSFILTGQAGTIPDGGFFFPKARLFHLSFELGVQFPYPCQCVMLPLLDRQGYPAYP